MHCLLLPLLNVTISYSLPMLASHKISYFFVFQFIYDIKKKGLMVPFKGEREVNVQSSAVNIIRCIIYRISEKDFTFFKNSVVWWAPS